MTTKKNLTQDQLVESLAELNVQMMAGLFTSLYNSGVSRFDSQQVFEKVSEELSKLSKTAAKLAVVILTKGVEADELKSYFNLAREQAEAGEPH